ncbi:hypothetical protein JNW91_31515 [Micromonospora sp. STR1_7]|uniref:Uncharacterized protein n=1 Tax=Micromonospora parastrephiae TaxID=2806101 RepID=A0ABS1Y2X6_9ACTN|nr:hypothetical protein [Micromonospora parastrephiae]MBM0235868.1 hypothetical protein [Micromonospora parastrephiae]
MTLDRADRPTLRPVDALGGAPGCPAHSPTPSGADWTGYPPGYGPRVVAPR